MLKTFVQELYQEWELKAFPQEDATGGYKIPLDSDLYFTISPLAEGGFYLFSQIATLKNPLEEPLLSKTLEANLFGQGTNGACLGLNDKGTVLTLSRLIDYDFNSKEFKDIVEDFINAIDFWREEAKKEMISPT